MKDKLIKIFTLLLATILLLTTFSMAAYSDVTMEVVREPVCHIDITDRSYFEKSIIGKDLANKEVTIQLKVVNDELPIIPNGEIVFLIDNSLSMTDENSLVNGVTRYKIIQDSAKQLAEQLLASNSDLEIAIASFSSAQASNEEGTDKDAQTILELNNNISDIKSAIDGIPSNGSRTDLEIGLDTANALFSGEEGKEKYMIILTDGVPNISRGLTLPYYAEETFTKTKTKLESLNSDDVHLFTMLTKPEEPDKVPEGGETTKTYDEIAEAIFGTSASPTAGHYYYVDDRDVEKTITEDIFNDLSPSYISLTNIKVTDYFPKEIIDNFDFAYVSDPTHGEISPSVDTANNSITWEIPELKMGETAIVQYKLKLKENFDTSILDKLLNTNNGIELDYTDFDGEEQHKESDVTPQLKLTMPTPSPSPVTPTPSTPKPPRLPAAGSQMFILSIAVAGGIAGFSLLRYAILKNKLK